MINLKFKLIYIIIINSIAFILSIIALYDTHRVKKKFEKILKNKEEQQKTRREGTICEEIKLENYFRGDL